MRKSLKKDPRLSLLYRGSRDGFSSAAFHSRCDLKGRTLTIAKSTQGRVFGGYASVDWKAKYNDYRHDNKAFLFSLTSLVKIELVDPHKAIYSHDKFLPTFGYDDLRIV